MSRDECLDMDPKPFVTQVAKNEPLNTAARPSKRYFHDVKFQQFSIFDHFALKKLKEKKFPGNNFEVDCREQYRSIHSTNRRFWHIA